MDAVILHLCVVQGNYYPQEVLLRFSFFASIDNCIYCTYVFDLRFNSYSAFQSFSWAPFFPIMETFYVTRFALNIHHYVVFRSYLCLTYHSFGFCFVLILIGEHYRYLHII